MQDDNVKQLRKTNPALQRLDDRIVEAINQTAREQPLTSAEVFGVFRTIEMRFMLQGAKK